MNISAKVAVAAFAPALLAALLLIPGPAIADPEDQGNSTSNGTSKPAHPPRSEHDDIRERYGDVEQINLPPLVIKDKPASLGSGKAGTKPSTATQKTNLKDAVNVNPSSNLPVNPAEIIVKKLTPADVFFQTATFGIGLMGVGAAALAIFAIRRSARIRRDQKADFIYQ